jgi:large subunit ribosomal protein L21
MKYAVIQLSGKQYKVAEGDQLTVNSLDAKEGEELKISDVLLTADGDKLQIGTPLVNKAVVTLKVMTHGKGDKIRVAKFRSKSRYRRVHGHRQHETVVQVTKIA